MNATTPLIYTRASMDRLYLKRSVGDQETDCRAWCDQQGWRVGRVITDANRSVSQWRTREREGFEEALRLIRSASFDAFVTWEPSRAGREMPAYIQLRAPCQEASVLYLTKGRVYDFSRSDDAFMMGLEFLTAEKDAATIRERQLRSVRLNAQKGRPHGKLPYGYRRVYDATTGVLLRQEIDPDQANLIRTAIAEIMRGVPVNRIVNRLNAQGVPTPKKPTSDHSRGWMSATLRQIIKNPTIAGLRVYRGGIIGEADWPAIVPVKQWEEVNQILADKSRRVRYVDEDNHSHPKWLLSHIARCGYCGRPLTRLLGTVPRKDGSQRNNYVCPFTGCRTISSDVTRTDAYITGALIGWLSTPESLAMLSDPEDQWLDLVKQAQALATELRQRLDDAAGEYAEGRISLGMLSSLEQRLTPQIEQASKDAVPPVADENLAALLDADDIEHAWTNLDLVEQRRLLKSLLDIRIEKATQLGGKFHPDRIKIAPRFTPPRAHRWQPDSGAGQSPVAGLPLNRLHETTKT